MLVEAYPTVGDKVRVDEAAGPQNTAEEADKGAAVANSDVDKGSK
jgi:hypothetical protein